MVVCPAIAVGVWQREVATWWTEAAAVLLRDLVPTGYITAEDRFALILEGVPLPDAPTFVISSYDFLTVNTRAQKWIAGLGRFDLAIPDEVHALKNASAKRTQLLFGSRCGGDGLLARCARVLLMSGTPAPNGHPSELWPALHALVPDLIDGLGLDAFIAKYCLTRPRPIKGGRTVMQIVGANPATTGELAKRLRPFWHRPPRAEVERDLPTFRVVIRHLPTYGFDPAVLAAIENSHEVDQLRAAVATGDLRHIEGSVARVRRLLALLKVQATAAWVEDVLDQGERKVLVWGWHVEPLHDLKRRLHRHKPVLIDGQTSGKDRDAAVAAFQTDPTCRVFIGQIAAAGTAITLTAGRRAVFLEQSFVPGHNHQSREESAPARPEAGVLGRGPSRSRQHRRSGRHLARPEGA